VSGLWIDSRLRRLILLGLVLLTDISHLNSEARLQVKCCVSTERVFNIRRGHPMSRVHYSISLRYIMVLVLDSGSRSDDGRLRPYGLYFAPRSRSSMRFIVWICAFEIRRINCLCRIWVYWKLHSTRF
jgi:hypothetical protein